MSVPTGAHGDSDLPVLVHHESPEVGGRPLGVREVHSDALRLLTSPPPLGQVAALTPGPR